MKLTAEQHRQIEQGLLNELPIKVKGESIEYNNYVIRQDKSDMWCLYANFNGLDLVDKFNLRISAVMAAKKYEKVAIREFNSIKTIDQHYNQLRNDIKIFEYLIKKTSDVEKKDNYYFRLQECKLRIRRVQFEIESMYRCTFR